LAQAAKTICNHAGCGRRTHGSYCQFHIKDKTERAPDRRGTAASRGYDHIWRKLRAQFVLMYPLCLHCDERGRVTPAKDVDHIIPFKGLDDPLRLDWSNLRGLCRACHNRVTHGK
jgi:5-methylcytosine-specific restriction protein A